MLLLSREEVERLYLVEGKSVKEIAPLTGKSENTVHLQMKKWGIPKRSRAEVNNQGWRKKGKLGKPSREELERLYIKEQKSTHEIARMFKVAQITAISWVRSFGIPVRNRSESNKLRNLRGVSNPAWKGGRYINKEGYICVRVPDHPLASSSGYVKEHVLAWEESHGRSLPKGYVIHHVDGIRTNNRPSNLLAMKQSDHMKLHRQELSSMKALEDQISILLDRLLLLEAEIELLKAGRPEEVVR